MGANYTRKTWVDGASGGTPLDAANLNPIEAGLVAIDNAKPDFADVAATVTASGALVSGKHNPVDATSGALAMTLANATAPNQQVTVEKVDSSANAVTITLNLRGTPASTFQLVLAHESIELQSKADGSWWPVAGHKTLSSLNAAFVQAPSSGSNGQVLTKDSTVTPQGVKWAAASGGSGTDASLASAHLVRYVDPGSGSDSNNGLTPKAAFATIAAAHADLVTVATATYSNVTGGTGLGVGRIELLPGRHNIGAGLAMDYKYPVEIIGRRSGRHSHLMSNSASVIYSTSSAATYFFRMHGTNVGYGWLFRDIHFEIDQTVNTSLVSIINPDSIDDFVVQNCSADTADNTTNTSVWFVKHDNTLTAPTGDAAWFRILDCRYSRVSLYYGSGSTNIGNYNKFTIARNVGFYGGSNAHCQFAGNISGGTVENNDFEGTATGILVGPTGSMQQCMFIGNSGEDDTSGTPANPFYDFTGSTSQMIIIGGAVSAPNATSGIFARFNTTSYNNLVIGPYDTATHSGMKRQIVDNSTFGNRLINLTSGTVLKVKSGSSNPTIADSDFTPAPQDGTTALGVNTTSGETRLWVRANGTWGFISTLGSYSPPVTTKGDLFGFSTVAARVPVGSDAQVLTADSTQTLGIKWAAAPADATKAALLIPTAVKTANYTAAAGDYVPCDTSGGTFTVTLPTAPADKTQIAVDLITAGNALTVARGGSDVFYKTSGATSIAVNTAGRVLLLQYQATGAIWHVLDHVPSLLTTKGDLLAYSTAQIRLAVGSDGQALVADSTQAAGIKWATLSGTGAVATDSIWTTKGDLAVGTGSSTASRLGVGGALSDRLIADSAASSGLKWAPHAIARTSDGSAITSGNTGATLTNDGVLALPLGASEIWFIQAWLLIFTANTTMDVKLGFTGPAGASMVWGFGGAAGAAVQGYGAWATSGGASAGMNGIGGTVSVGGVNAVTSGVLLAGTVTNSTTAGTLNLQLAQNVADAGNLIMKAGSLLLCWRIA